MKKIALIVAGGIGSRMRSSVPKQFLLLKGVPILMRTLEKFLQFEQIILVLPPTQFDFWRELCKTHKFTQEHTLVAGGETRFQSVKNGLEKIITKNTVVAIHDGVRPLISTTLINILVAKNRKGIGVVPVIPVKDSIRKVEADNSNHIDRSNLYIVQTPQCFLSACIKKAYTQEFSEHFTDDASVFESYGGRITTLIGEEKNLKITTAEDLRIAEALI